MYLHPGFCNTFLFGSVFFYMENEEDRPGDTRASSSTSVKNRDKGRSREGESEEKAERERASSVALLN